MEKAELQHISCSAVSSLILLFRYSTARDTHHALPSLSPTVLVCILVIRLFLRHGVLIFSHPHSCFFAM